MADVQNRISYVTSENNDLEFDLFKAALNEAIQRHAPIKQRYVRANQAPFINKTINKEIMKSSQLRNKFLNTKSDIDRKAYNKQHNLCVSLICRKRKTSLIILVPVTSQTIKRFGRQYNLYLQIRYKQNLKLHLLKKKLFPEKGKSK